MAAGGWPVTAGARFPAFRCRRAANSYRTIGAGASTMRMRSHEP